MLPNMTDRFSAVTIGAVKDSVKSVEIAGFVLTDLIHPPNEVLRWHSHERASLVLYITGAVTQNFKTKSIECDSRTLIIKPPAEPHCDRYGPARSRKLAIEIGPERLQALHPFSKSFDQVSHITSGKIPLLVMRVYKEFINMDSASMLAMEGLLLETVAEVSRYSIRGVKQRPPRWLNQARDILHTNFSESMSLSSIALTVGTHPVVLASKFRKFFGCSVGEYLRKLRIERASRLLSTTSMPLFTIASEAGFSDHAHFSRTFKRFTEMTPSQYRAMFRPR